MITVAEWDLIEGRGEVKQEYRKGKIEGAYTNSVGPFFQFQWVLLDSWLLLEQEETIVRTFN